MHIKFPVTLAPETQFRDKLQLSMPKNGKLEVVE